VSSYKIAKLIKPFSNYKCEICNKHRMGKVYEYQSISFVRGYVPRHFKEMCGDCIYKEVYGTNLYKKKKKEGSLDK